MISLTNRAQDWLAERIHAVPFSASRVIEHGAKAPLFANAMPWYLRGFLVLIGAVMIVIAAIALAFLALFFWALFTA